MVSIFSPPADKSNRRWSSAMPPPPPPAQERKKPPRLSLSFHKSASMTNVSETPNRMRKRLSSFLTTSPISFKSSHSSNTIPEEDAPSLSSSSDDLASPVDHVTNDYVKQPMGLAQLVQIELGSVIKQVDEEIDLEWERSRRILRQSLSLPVGIL
ncbi:hypothetical protein BJV82DRAFT_634555 [Fennellomyces sp. T-0311]|nr:hypothetical protein BJV82DRAFT_634555 [Fennellomyces sp. T-0311]